MSWVLIIDSHGNAVCYMYKCTWYNIYQEKSLSVACGRSVVFYGNSIFTSTNKTDCHMKQLHVYKYIVCTCISWLTPTQTKWSSQSVLKISCKLIMTIIGPDKTCDPYVEYLKIVGCFCSVGVVYPKFAG